MPKQDLSASLEQIILEVQASPKYRIIAPELVRHVATQELQKRRNIKEVVKATRNKLHQIGGAYLEARDESTDWFQRLQSAKQSDDQTTLQSTCREIMHSHASTRERLPILEDFYQTIFTALPPVHSLLDLACGLNPLALPWMQLEPDCTYYACDIYQNITTFLTQSFRLLGVNGQAWVCDLTRVTPTQSVDVVLLLKTLPCLEQLDKQSSQRLLQQLNARHIIVSYPLHSLSGRGGKGMAQFYENQLYTLIIDTSWQVQRYSFANELAFILTKGE